MKGFLVCSVALCALSLVPASAGVLYVNDPANGLANDPINGGFGPPGSQGNGDAWTINQGFWVSDSFTLAGNSVIGGFDFVTWNFAGDVTTAVDWSIGTSPDGSDVASGTASLTNSFFATNPETYSIYTNSAGGLSIALGAGTYWLTLQNADAGNGDPVYWDENDGPSAAFESSVGSLANGGGNTCANGAVDGNGDPSCTGSETFDITTPEPGSLSLLAGGLFAMAGLLRRKKA